MARVTPAFRDQGAPSPVVSGTLTLAARELAALAASGETAPLARTRVRAALWHAGGADPSPAAYLVSGPAGRLVEALAGLLPSRAAASHLGAGVTEREGTFWLVLLASNRRTRLDPFPQRVAVGASEALTGQLGTGLAEPRLFVTSPDGQVAEASVTGARSFRTAVHFTGAGRWLVEVVARGPNGPEVTALLAVVAGEGRLDLPAGSVALDTDDPAAAELRVVAAINATRRQHGLQPLAPSDALQAVARRQSAEMLASGLLAHTLPGTGDVGERLRRAHIPYRRALENLAKGQSALAAHEATEESPAHRENLLAPEPTRVGVGLARTSLPGGGPLVYLTEIFVEPGEDHAGDRRTPEELVRAALWKERERLGLPPLLADARLDDLARQAASTLRGGSEPDLEAVGRSAVAGGSGVAAADVFIASSPGEAIRSKNLGRAGYRRVGVGVAIGDSPRYGEGRLFIAVIYDGSGLSGDRGSR